MRDFVYSTNNIFRLLPPPKNGFVEHVKRASYEAGWVSYQRLKNITLPDPKNGDVL